MNNIVSDGLTAAAVVYNTVSDGFRIISILIASRLWLVAGVFLLHGEPFLMLLSHRGVLKVVRVSMINKTKVETSWKIWLQ